MIILSTDGGPHTADKWAAATAEMLVPLGAIDDGARRTAAMRLQADVADALMPHHQGVADAEANGLAENGSDHLLTDFDSDDYVPDALAAVIKAAKGTLWEAHFSESAVQEQIALVLASHFNTGADVARQWHADANPDCPIAAAYKAERHSETVIPDDEAIAPAIQPEPYVAPTPAPADPPAA